MNNLSLILQPIQNKFIISQPIQKIIDGKILYSFLPLSCCINEQSEKKFLGVFFNLGEFQLICPWCFYYETEYIFFIGTVSYFCIVKYEKIKDLQKNCVIDCVKFQDELIPPDICADLYKTLGRKNEQ